MSEAAKQPEQHLPERGRPETGQSDYYSSVPAGHGFERKLAFLRRYWWVPVLTTVACLGGAIGYIMTMPPTYVSTAQMWETEKLRLSEGASFTEDLGNYYGTQMSLLQSDRMIQMAFESLQATGTNAVPRSPNGKPLPVKVKVTQQPRSAVFILEVSSSNPDYAQRFLNSLMAVFQNYRKNIRQTVSGTTFASISDQVQKLELDLRTDEHALEVFQRTNNLAILQAEGTISGGYLARLRTDLADLQLEQQLLEATARDQESASTSGTNTAPYLLNGLRSTASSAALGTVERQTAYKELEILKVQRSRLSKYLKPRHPKIVKIDTDIERGQKLVDLFRTQTLDQLASARQAIKMHIESTQAAIKQWEAKVVEFKSRITDVERLKANVARSQSLYDRLMVLLENVDITRNINQESFSVLQPASTAERTYRSEVKLLGLAVVFGLAVGVGLVFLVEFRDDRFTSVQEVTDQFGECVIGQVPELKKLDGEKAAILFEDADGQQMLAESYRNLRSALLFIPADTQRPSVILVTSALPNEGKSTIAVNLAKAMALGGVRVLLVDADLRKGALHEALGLKAEPGLTELLVGPKVGMQSRGHVVSSSCGPLQENPISDVGHQKSEVRDLPSESVTQTNGIPNFDFLARGGSTNRHPGDLFLGGNLDMLLFRWRQQYEYIILDGCPVFAADDATTLAPKVDGTLFVVRRRFASSRAVREAIDLILQREANVLGLVFNCADASAVSYCRFKYAESYEERA